MFVVRTNIVVIIGASVGSALLFLISPLFVFIVRLLASLGRILHGKDFGRRGRGLSVFLGSINVLL